MGALIDDLRPGPAAIDAVVFIYFVERNPDYIEVVRPVFATVAAGDLEAFTSGVTLLEVLVAPYRAGDPELAGRYEAMLTRTRGVHLVDLDRALLRSAALLRATSRLRLADALQVAAARAAGCTALVTNDRDLPPFPGLRVIQLRDYLPGRA